MEKWTVGKMKAAAAWFEKHMPPMPGAREMYRAAAEALRAVPGLLEERDALLKAARSGATCDNCRHMEESASKCNDDMGPCSSCEVDCYCKDCFENSKWELKIS